MAESNVLRILFIGSGVVNFGGGEGPWNHSKRLEVVGGVNIVAIADPDLEKAETVLKKKLAGPHAHLYQDCVTLKNYKEAISIAKPHVAFIGVPPVHHGSSDPPLDIEVQCLKAGLHVFIEKPVSVIPPEAFTPYVDAVEKIAEEKQLVVSVGYMFRYHTAIQKMKSLIEAHGRPLISINAKYVCAYSELDRPFWWNVMKSGGPIVEQATHFCDLVRYLGGEVVPASISTLAVPASNELSSPGYLSQVPANVNEDQLPSDRRVPRLTNGHWLFCSGAVGSLTHGVTLHGRRYETAIEVWADGLRLALQDPYFPECTLRARIGDTDEEEVYHFPDADPYLTEVEVFLEAVRTGDKTLVRSPYRDAAKTYQLSWEIRRASEK